MSLWRLTYNRYGRLHGVVIVEAASLISACVGVADNALDKGVSFVEGHELDAERERRIPPGYVGHDALSQRGRTASQEDRAGRRKKAVDAVNAALSSLSQISGMSMREYQFQITNWSAGAFLTVDPCTMLSFTSEANPNTTLKASRRTVGPKCDTALSLPMCCAGRVAHVGGVSPRFLL
jgi:hypothetical protein